MPGRAEEFGGINDAIRGATRELGDQSEIQQKILKGAQDCREEYGAMAGSVTKLIQQNGKLYVNSCRCTPNEIIEATKIIFGATEVVYSERRDVPATIYLSISAPFSDLVLSILGTHDLVVHPAGVRVRINCSTEDAETFGFVDLNPRVAGFGEGMFAQSIN